MVTQILVKGWVIPGLVGLAALLGQGASYASAVKDLAPFLWQNRLILVSAPVQQAAQLRRQLEAAESEIDDRHIIWFVHSDVGTESNYRGRLHDKLPQALAKRWRQAHLVETQVALAGKDGGTRLQIDELDLPMIFATIDGMPMRQLEMQRNAASRQMPGAVLK